MSLALPATLKVVRRSPTDADQILAALPDALLVLDAEDRIVQVNPAAEPMFSASGTALQGRTLGQVVGEDAPVVGLVGRARADGSTISAYDVPLYAARHEAIEVDARAAPVSEAGDVVLVLRERSAARRLGEQVARNASGRSLAGLAAVLAHEVRNPLSGIRGAAQLIGRDAPEGQHELARLIVAEADRIRALVESMEVIGERGIQPRSAVNIHEVLDHVRRLAASGFAEGVVFADRFDPSLPEVEGARDRLIQLFLNLVKNAAEAAGGDGRIELGTAYDLGRRLDGAAIPIVITIEDDGPGIPETVRANLFEPFASTRAQGRGLGLAIVAAIVADHGGTIEVESAPGRTVFRVALPAAREAAR